MPTIYLPLSSLDSCSTCGAAKDLRLCSQCAERAYCSTQCQKTDWKSHKTTCKTDRIDLASFYPVIACIIEALHMRSMPPHPAVQHTITNAPNPDSPPSFLRDGSVARLVRLGAPVPQDSWGHDLSKWWPQGKTPAVRAKLTRRIMREGNVLPFVVSSCLGLLLSLYSTTTEPSSAAQHRVRLRYRSSPISDFGVAAGSARVTPEDQLAYILPDGTLRKGQDPTDHYWLYFRTVKGEEVELDCSLFTFNMCIAVNTAPYATPAMAVSSYVPAWFKDRVMVRGLPPGDAARLLTARRRVSALRDPALAAGLEPAIILPDGKVSMPRETEDAIADFMARVAGRPVAAPQVDKCIDDMIYGLNVVLDAAVRTDAWKTFPERPLTGIESDPGEEF